VQGAAVAEKLRTFGGRIFRLGDHLDRLERSLQVIGVDPGLSRNQWIDTAEEIVKRNHPLLAPGDDLNLSIFVTPGITTLESNSPTVCLQTNPLPFHLWVEKYRVGQFLATTPIEQIPPSCWPPELKCRSRMHYFLADQLAARQFPSARAVLLDRDGFVTETSTTNILIFRKSEGLISPPSTKILHGISLAATFEIAGRLGIPCCEEELTEADLASADEIILTSTSSCLLPATQFNGHSVGNGRPGEIFHRLLAAWNDVVGLDIAGQAERFGGKRR
jgi:branched-subunit amino acid aminotransferase/4-amino-4-deoxychorismate lyase